MGSAQAIMLKNGIAKTATIATATTTAIVRA